MIPSFLETVRNYKSNDRCVESAHARDETARPPMPG